jgi:hypothetical protein
MSSYDDPHVSAGEIADYLDKLRLATSPQPARPLHPMASSSFKPNPIATALVLVAFMACLYFALYIALH